MLHVILVDCNSTTTHPGRAYARQYSEHSRWLRPVHRSPDEVRSAISTTPCAATPQGISPKPHTLHTSHTSHTYVSSEGPDAVLRHQVQGGADVHLGLRVALPARQ